MRAGQAGRQARRERKLLVTISNVTTGSGTTVYVFAVLSSPGPALRSAASLRVSSAAERMPCVHSPTYPPYVPRLILGLPPGWYALW